LSELYECGLAELVERVERGEASCIEIAQSFLGRIDSVEPAVGALLVVRGDEALREAAAADEARAIGRQVGPLHGLPFVAKDNLVSPDFETTCASKILEGFRAPYSSTVLARLGDAGMIALATANMDEFAMGSSCENSAKGSTRNPWDLERVPGGSSGGSAASVAAREAPAALGSDTGGSIRLPAALCGVVGLKPTYGRVSRYGLVAFASSLDQIGPLTRSVRDSALMLGAIAGHDPKDSTSLDVPVPDYAAALEGDSDLSGLRIGVPREWLDDEGMDPATRASVREAIAELERAGGAIVDVSLPHSPYATPAYYLICTAEASSNLSRYDGVRFGYRAEADDYRQMYRRTRSAGFGAEVKRRIMLGTFVLSAGYYDAYYRKAQQVRTLIRRDFEQVFQECDLLAAPTSPGRAWPLGERTRDPLAMYLSDVFTVSANLAGLPALSLPCGQTEGLPEALQLIGPPLGEPALLRAGHVYQQRTDWHTRAPAL